MTFEHGKFCRNKHAANMFRKWTRDNVLLHSSFFNIRSQKLMCPVNARLSHTNKDRTNKKMLIKKKLACNNIRKSQTIVYLCYNIYKKAKLSEKGKSEPQNKNLTHFCFFLIIKQANFVLTLNKPLDSFYANIFNRGKRVKNLYSCQTQAPPPTAEYRQWTVHGSLFSPDAQRWPPH